MKIGVVTFHQALNYGASLQMYALQKALEKASEGNKIEVIDYQSPYLTEYYSLKKQSGKNIIFKALKSVHFLLKRRKFKLFIQKHLKLSSKQYDELSISEANKDYDLIIVGSDQVWNPRLTNGDLNFYLDFVDKLPRYSYAASIGLQCFPNEMCSKIKENLEKFSEISIREKSAKELVDSILENNNSHVDLDPTLLLTAEEWLPLCSRKKRKGYVLVYTVEYSKSIIEEAITFGKSKGLEIIYVGQFTNISGIKYFSCPSIELLLSFFRDADYIFANSFHGTVFSILFHKMFYSKLELKDGRNSRITNLLEICELSDRVTLSNIDKKVDWIKVDQKIQSHKTESISYLKRIVSHGKEQN